MIKVENLKRRIINEYFIEEESEDMLKLIGKNSGAVYTIDCVNEIITHAFPSKYNILDTTQGEILHELRNLSTYMLGAYFG